ncbi:hypothetical protein [Mycobacterium sp. GA-2829]|uniref:hypothetical protein n=1 Tax=Mycobacterium sp. GA-2829 TaxID=1772283 RepID=UPI000AE16B0B|nr:hypothetical protein [Mycobacterium sp. GA-2829]
MTARRVIFPGDDYWLPADQQPASRRRANKSRPCRTCRTTTRSITGYCTTCRPADAIPTIHRDGNTISFAGLNLTPAQAIALADALVDAVEKGPTP